MISYASSYPLSISLRATRLVESYQGLQVCTLAQFHICTGARLQVFQSFHRGLSLREGRNPIKTVPSISIKSKRPIMMISSLDLPAGRSQNGSAETSATSHPR